jgi:hypothetical protein
MPKQPTFWEVVRRVCVLIVFLLVLAGFCFAQYQSAEELYGGPKVYSRVVTDHESGEQKTWYWIINDKGEKVYTDASGKPL